MKILLLFFYFSNNERIDVKDITNHLNYCEIYKSHYHNYLNSKKDHSSDRNMREEL